MDKDKSFAITKYEGVIPVHQRLVLLASDFLESTHEFALNDLFNLQTVMSDFDHMVDKEKASKLVRLTRELFKKY